MLWPAASRLAQHLCDAKEAPGGRAWEQQKVLEVGFFIFVLVLVFEKKQIIFCSHCKVSLFELAQ